jgi:hypothetical protein
MVLRTCESGMRARLAPAPEGPEQALALLMQTPAVTLFRRGFRAREEAGGGVTSRGR